MLIRIKKRSERNGEPVEKKELMLKEINWKDEN